LRTEIFGTTGIVKLSTASGARVRVFVQVTVDHICAPQDHPLFVKLDAGPVIPHGRVNTIV
jgi:hypothetical protein